MGEQDLDELGGRLVAGWLVRGREHGWVDGWTDGQVARRCRGCRRHGAGWVVVRARPAEGRRVGAQTRTANPVMDGDTGGAS